MDIHKPKPVHSWREFLKEVGTIVLGVSIALGAEQTVEWLHWRNKVTEARQSIATEMAGNVNNAIVRMRTKDCTERRLDELAQILDTASRTGSLPPLGAIGGPPRRRWAAGAWDSVMASQTAAHFPRQQLSDMARMYTYVTAVNDRATEETITWSHLSTMVGPGRRLDPASEAELRKSLSEARTYNRNFVISSYVILGIQKTLDLPYSKNDLAMISATRNDSLTIRRPITVEYYSRQSQSCQPIGAVPPQYGQASVPDIPGLTEAGMKLLPEGH